MTDDTPGTGYLPGQLLIAMPQMSDPRFARSVVYLCAHNEDGAMGLVVNKLITSLTFGELLKQMDMDFEAHDAGFGVHFGGPVESGRGFVLHSTDYESDATMTVNSEFALTATIDVLQCMADGRGPNNAILALGYAGWAPGQLDTEIQNNGWLHAPADLQLVFDKDNDTKWERAVAMMGIDPSFLSMDAGHA